MAPLCRAVLRACRFSDYPRDVSTGVSLSFGGLSGAPLAAILAQYPLASYPSPSIALGAAGTDGIFACNSRTSIRRMANFVPVFAYEFNDQNAPMLFLPPVSFPYGAAHTSELQYIFNLPQSVNNPLSADQIQLSNDMVKYWTQFARSGNPNSSFTPFWPEYNSTDDIFQSLNTPSPTTEGEFYSDHKCGFWGVLLGTGN